VTGEAPKGAERQEGSTIVANRHVFCDAPHPSINARTLAHLDLDGFRFRLLGFREMDVEHPLLVIRGHLASI
jgi:hypothetical protein